MNCLENFIEYRPVLFAIAYRMLGSVVDAEDMVQETFIRCQQATQIPLHPKTYLSTIVTRLCIDYLRSARVQRERYVGSWLPEPLITEPYGVDRTELTESLSFAFLILLECLSPIERAIFLLREVFDYDYEDIARIVDKSIPNCRQIFHRARQHLVLRQPNINTSVQQKEQIIERFLASWNQGDVKGLVAAMAENVTLWSDGGGQVVAALKPLYGSLKVARFLSAIRASKLLPVFTSHTFQINGQPGIINFVENHPQSVFCFEFDDGYVQSIFAVVNPDKLSLISSSIHLNPKSTIV